MPDTAFSVSGARRAARDLALEYPVLADNTSAAELAAALVTAATDAAAAQFVIVGTIGTLKEIIGAGVPAASARATLNVNPAGDDNSLTYTAVVYGTGGHAITIAYVDPGANDAELSVTILGSAITVNLATGVAGAITSTAADILAEIEATPAADALVVPTIHTADTGVGDDGSGIVTAMAAAPLAGGTGVGIGIAGIGSRYTDVTNGTLYLNTGTLAAPVWTQLAPV